MENLQKVNDENFAEIVAKMPLEELQDLIWKLEEELKKMKEEREAEIQQNPELDRLGFAKPAQLEKFAERSKLRTSIMICQETIQSRFYNKTHNTQLDSEMIRNSEWGIVEREPKNIIENANTAMRCWKKYGGDAPVQEPVKMTITHVADFYWNNQLGGDFKKLFEGNKPIRFEVPSRTINEDKVEVNVEDLIKGYKEAQNKYANLKLVKVIVQGAANLEYFMLMDIEQLSEMNQEELQGFLTKIYTSKVHQEEVGKCLNNSRCLYGGIIGRNANGNLQLKFGERDINASVAANLFAGRYRTIEGKDEVVGNLQHAAEHLVGRQNRQQALKALESIRTGMER